MTSHATTHRQTSNDAKECSSTRQGVPNCLGAPSAAMYDIRGSIWQFGPNLRRSNRNNSQSAAPRSSSFQLHPQPIHLSTALLCSFATRKTFPFGSVTLFDVPSSRTLVFDFDLDHPFSSTFSSFNHLSYDIPQSPSTQWIPFGLSSSR